MGWYDYFNMHLEWWDGEKGQELADYQIKSIMHDLFRSYPDEDIDGFMPIFGEKAGRQLTRPCLPMQRSRFIKMLQPPPGERGYIF